MNILLTGASGFLGVHLLNNLINNGYTVYALVRSIETLYEKFQYFNISLYNTKGTLKIIETKDVLSFDFSSLQNIDLVINSIGKVSNYGEYTDFFDSNVLITKKLAEFYKNKLIHISTLSVFVADKNNFGVHTEQSPP